MFIILEAVILSEIRIVFLPVQNLPLFCQEVLKVLNNIHLHQQDDILLAELDLAVLVVLVL
jgi:hypothetical protein